MKKILRICWIVLNSLKPLDSERVAKYKAMPIEYKKPTDKDEDYEG